MGKKSIQNTIMKKALVLGGGVGGIVAATVLKKALGTKTQVTLIDKEELHYYQSSYPFLMIGERKPYSITRKLSRLENIGISFLRAEVTELDLAAHHILTTKGSIDFDFLVISLGVEYHPEVVPGFSQYAYNAYQFSDVIKIKQQLSQFNSGSIILFISSTPYKCPPAPYEMMFLLDQYFRQRGKRSNVNLTLVTPDITPEPLAKPLVGQSVRKTLASKNIELITEAKVLALEQNELVLDHGNRIPGDLFLGIAPHWTPHVLRNTDLVDGDGWVIVDQHTLQTRHPEVFAIGDAAAIRLPVIGSLAPKAGVFAHYQAEVVARNIASTICGLPATFKYTGKGA